MNNQPTSFLLNVPSAVDPQQRLILDAIGFSLDAIDLATRRMRETAATVPPLDYTRKMKVALFSDAWTIVDQTHLLRSLLAKLIESGVDIPEFRSFIARFEAASALRNKMDHITNNIPNSAKSKLSQPPLHGALSFLLWRLKPDKIAVWKNGGANCGVDDILMSKIVSLTVGACHRDNHSFSVVNPSGHRLEYPVGGLSLHAFDQFLDLSDVSFAASQLSDRFDDEIRRAFDDQLRAQAAARGITAEALLEPRATGITSVMDIKFHS